MRKRLKKIEDLLEYIEKSINLQKRTIQSIENQCGMSSGVISRWKKWKNGPTFSNVIELIEALGASLYIEDNIQQEEPTSAIKIELMEILKTYLAENAPAKQEFFKIMEIIEKSDVNQEKFLSTFKLFLLYMSKPT